MTMKSILMVGVLALSTLSLASASTKTYEITLSSPSKVGSMQLAAGSYKLKVDGNKAVFTNRDTDKQVTADVKVDTVEKKYEVTAIDSTKTGDVEQINAIELGGSKTKLEFGGL
jgi:hypothetical protein